MGFLLEDTLSFLSSKPWSFLKQPTHTYIQYKYIHLFVCEYMCIYVHPYLRVSSCSHYYLEKQTNNWTELLMVCSFSSKDAKIDPEEFTGRLQSELKSSPQPYLVPFLKVMWILFKLVYFNANVNISSFKIHFLSGISFTHLKWDFSIFTLWYQFLLKSAQLQKLYSKNCTLLLQCIYFSVVRFL